MRSLHNLHLPSFPPPHLPTPRGHHWSALYVCEVVFVSETYFASKNMTQRYTLQTRHLEIFSKSATS